MRITFYYVSSEFLFFSVFIMSSYFSAPDMPDIADFTFLGAQYRILLYIHEFFLGNSQ